MNDIQQLRSSVCKACSAAAEQPEAKHPFPVGRTFAESVGYPASLLDQLPTVASEAFTGVSNVSLFADIPAGAVVLDLGCGAGLDSLVAAHRAGLQGKVVGVDFSEAMLNRASHAATEAQMHNIELRRGDAESLPLEDNSVDVAIINGIFNLNPVRETIFHELARVVRPGGSVYSAEIILREPLPPEEQRDITNWFA